MSNSRKDFGSASQSDTPSKINSSDDRSVTAKAATWATQIMTISLEMVVPGLCGYWLDNLLGTKFLLMLIGFVFGFTAAIKHLLYLANKAGKETNKLASSQKKNTKEQR